jgi:hypothetical protein
MLFVTFLLMGLCTTAIGLIPTYESIGIWAAVLLVTFRIIQASVQGLNLRVLQLPRMNMPLKINAVVKVHGLLWV